MHGRLESAHVHSSFNSYFKGHILSSKPSSKPGVRSKGELNVTTKKGVAESVNEAKASQQAEHEVRERRNGYQMISTAAYYRTERRGLSGFGKAQDWLDAKAEIDGVPGIDGAPYGERESDR